MKTSLKWTSTASTVDQEVDQQKSSVWSTSTKKTYLIDFVNTHLLYLRKSVNRHQQGCQMIFVSVKILPFKLCHCYLPIQTGTRSVSFLAWLIIVQSPCPIQFAILLPILTKLRFHNPQQKLRNEKQEYFDRDLGNFRVYPAQLSANP